MTPPLRLAAAATAFALIATGAVWAQAPETDRPDAALPDGPGKQVILRACTSCHDASQITYKLRTPEDWEFVIGKMMDGGAELTAEEQDAVYAYLVKNYGAKPPAAPDAGEKPPAR